MDEPGRVIADKYELVKVAGTGGMATVWRAIQHGPAGFQRPVAVKRVKESYAHDDKFRGLFVEEARVAAQITHPNVVQIVDFGVEDDRYFLVMEWVEGMSLSRYVRALSELSRRPEWPLLASIAIDVLKGLRSAHERRDDWGNAAPVFHRDVTPQNILMGENGVVKLTDFGLAQAADRARMTAPNVIKGKVGYIAPEMAESRTPTPQTDIYALGVCLWQALAGRRLFEGKDDVEVFVSAKKGDVPPLSEVAPHVPQAFCSIVERALARDPADRFQSAEQMSRVLARLLRTLPRRVDAVVIAASVTAIARFLSHGSVPPPAS